MLTVTVQRASPELARQPLHVANTQVQPLAHSIFVVLLTFPWLAERLRPPTVPLFKQA